MCGDDVAIVKEERPMVGSMQRNTGDGLHVAITIRRTQDYTYDTYGSGGHGKNSGLPFV